MINTIKYWRDLVIGEQILPGDRFIDSSGKWITVLAVHLSFEDTVKSHTRTHQRPAQLPEYHADDLKWFIQTIEWLSTKENDGGITTCDKHHGHGFKSDCAICRKISSVRVMLDEYSGSGDDEN